MCKLYFPGLSPIDKKAGEAPPRRAVVETPTLAGRERLGFFPARPLQGQFHLARSFCSCSASRSRSTGCSRGCLRPCPCSRPAPSPEAACRFRRCWLIIPLALAHNFSSVAHNSPSCGSKFPFLWLKTPFPVAHNSPSCGSKSPLFWLNSIEPQASLPDPFIFEASAGMLGILAIMAHGVRWWPHASFADFGGIQQSPVEQGKATIAHNRQKPCHSAVVSRRMAPLNEKWGKSRTARTLAMG